MNHMIIYYLDVLKLNKEEFCNENNRVFETYVGG